jgi:ZIP family zinc transporter
MSFGQTALLGALAGFTIYLGLPLGRATRVDDRVRVALAMLSVGILAFIFMDVTHAGMDIVETSLLAAKDHHGSVGRLVLLFALLAAGFTAGTAGIASVERRLRRRRPPPPIAGGEAAALTRPEQLATGRAGALRTGMTVAAAIGLHNFAEGLAIGVSANAGEIGLATVLIVGFALHNATEGFGIIGPLGSTRPSWRWLALVGLVGGAPTFIGAMIGYQVNSDALELCFYALAGGAILYVVGEIWAAMRRYGHRTLGLYMLSAGFLLGLATDLVVAYGGG